MEFLKLVDKHFPKNSTLHKCYNRNTLKVSYSTMANIGSIIQSHNKKLLGESILPTEKGCNCRKPQECPLDGKCLTESMIYKALVTDETNQTKYHYVGLSLVLLKTDTTTTHTLSGTTLRIQSSLNVYQSLRNRKSHTALNGQ